LEPVTRPPTGFGEGPRAKAADPRAEGWAPNFGSGNEPSDSSNPPASIPELPGVSNSTPPSRLSAPAAAAPNAEDSPPIPARERASPPPARRSPEVRSHSEPAAEASSAPQIKPTDLVAETLRMPEDSKITGRALPLLHFLSAVQDRGQQAAVTHAYWRLTNALANYRIAHDEAAELLNLQAGREDAVILGTAQASAMASLQGAEVAAVAAQYDLAESARLVPGAPLPLPADGPYIGAYRTLYADIAASRNPPLRAGLIDRLLPIGQEAVAKRAESAQAAGDVWQSVTESFQAGQTPLVTLLHCRRELTTQQQAMMFAVCLYNHNIADYAFSVADPQADTRTILSMLIKTKLSKGQIPAEKSSERPVDGGMGPVSILDRSPGMEFAPEDRSRVVPAEHTEPVSTGGDSQPWQSVQPAVAPTSAAAPRPTLAPPNDGDSSLRIARLQNGGQSASLTGPLYASLTEAKPAARARLLAGVLHAPQQPAPGEGKLVDLKTCLRSARPADRRDVVTKFWLARQRAAECLVLQTAAQMLSEMEPILLERRHTPTGGEEMVRVWARYRAMAAELEDVRVKLLEAQFDLSVKAGLAVNAPYAMPSTAPHAGSYELKIDQQSPELAQSWTVRRLGATIPALYQSLQSRATAVVQADQARDAAIAAFRKGTQPFDAVLSLVDQQTAESRAFLAALTAYNRAIADYVFTILPANMPPEKLVSTLVVTQ
jgi:hypothetical protein